MKIVICGSMAFAKSMLEAKNKLEALGHKVIVPEFTETYATNKNWQKRAKGPGTMIGAQRKIANDLIRKHYHEIVGGDAILVINKNKRGIKNYIGGNSFLEMGFAYILGKKIFVLNPLPEELTLIYQELVAMEPTIINGNLAKIK
jgi:hypothetical protein